MIFEIIKNVIDSGNFKLSEVTGRIDTVWAEGKITDAQREELHALVQSRLTPTGEMPDLQEQVKRLAEKMALLEERLAALEGGGTPAEEDEYPEWVPWDGVSDRYQKGAKVTHNGVRYISIFAGQNVWEPGSPGTESLWQTVTD